MTSKTEGRAFSDATGVPLRVKYDTRLRENVAKNIVQDVTLQVQVRTSAYLASSLEQPVLLAFCCVVCMHVKHSHTLSCLTCTVSVVCCLHASVFSLLTFL